MLKKVIHITLIGLNVLGNLNCEFFMDTISEMYDILSIIIDTDPMILNSKLMMCPKTIDRYLNADTFIHVSIVLKIDVNLTKRQKYIFISRISEDAQIENYEIFMHNKRIMYSNLQNLLYHLLLCFVWC